MNLNFKSTGEGSVLVILHGLFGSLDNWQTMANQISAEGYQVVTVDLRNHGKSPHSPEMSHEIMANDVAEFLNQYELDPCALLGHSMGGKTAMQLALTKPELLTKLIVVDIAPKPYPPHHDIYFDAMRNLDLSTVTSRGQAEEILAQKIKSPSILQFLTKNLSRTSEGKYEWKFDLESIYENYPKLIGGLSAQGEYREPTLFIGGQLSDYITPADEQEIYKYFPDADIEMIPNSGHWVHAEQPELFKNTVLRFLQV